MSVFEPEEQAPRERGPLLIVAGVAVVLVAALAWWFLGRAPEAPAPSSTPVARATSPSPAPTASPSPSPTATPTAAPRRERPKPAAPVAAAPEPEPVAAPTRTLVVESDVPGASVFLNRKYLGTTPLKSSDVPAGAVQLNASAEGYDGVAQSVDIAESGTTEVTVRFKEVRLNASVPVVHKHAMGSCEGTLRATVAGLRYDTTNKGDAFTMGFAELESFQIDYLEKALKVKKRGGKTWNFTTKDANADALFVFHRDVEKARQKLAK